MLDPVNEVVRRVLQSAGEVRALGEIVERGTDLSYGTWDVWDDVAGGAAVVNHQVRGGSGDLLVGVGVCASSKNEC